MKKVITLFSLIICSTVYSQNFSGIATYKTSMKVKSKITFGGNFSKQEKKALLNKMQKKFQKTYHLNFNKYASTYKQEVTLNIDGTSSGGLTYVLYKNTKENRYASKEDFLGKIFIIKDSLKQHNWELSTETKIIGKFTCYKATYKVEVPDIKTTVVASEIKTEIVTKQVTITAWYTPQIPINNGPEDYHGLPGLILEVSDGNNIILCKSILLNPEDVVKVIEPKKGTVVNEGEFKKIKEEKQKQFNYSQSKN